MTDETRDYKKLDELASEHPILLNLILHGLPLSAIDDLEAIGTSLMKNFDCLDENFVIEKAWPNHSKSTDVRLRFKNMRERHQFLAKLEKLKPLAYTCFYNQIDQMEPYSFIHENQTFSITCRDELDSNVEETFIKAKELFSNLPEYKVNFSWQGEDVEVHHGNVGYENAQLGKNWWILNEIQDAEDLRKNIEENTQKAD